MKDFLAAVIGVVAVCAVSAVVSLLAALPWIALAVVIKWLFF